jgi:hypothetical protein
MSDVVKVTPPLKEDKDSAKPYKDGLPAGVVLTDNSKYLQIPNLRLLLKAFFEKEHGNGKRPTYQGMGVLSNHEIYAFFGSYDNVARIKEVILAYPEYLQLMGVIRSPSDWFTHKDFDLMSRMMQICKTCDQWESEPKFEFGDESIFEEMDPEDQLNYLCGLP